MSDENYTQEEFLEQMQWEGSVEDGLNYGLKADDLDVSVNPDFVSAVADLETAYSVWEKARNAFISAWAEDYDL